MLFCKFAQASSLREITMGLQSCERNKEVLPVSGKDNPGTSNHTCLVDKDGDLDLILIGMPTTMQWYEER